MRPSSPWVHYLWAVNFVQSAPSRPPPARVPAAYSMATCCGTAAMSLDAAPAEAPIFPQLAPARPVLALMPTPGMLLISIIPPGASGAFPYDSPPLLCTRAQGAPGELSSALRILQLNMRHSSYSLDLLLQFLQTNRHDIVLIQDPPVALQSGRRSLPGYEVFLSRPCSWQPNNPAARRSLTAVLVRTSLRSQPCPGNFRRACGILVETRQGKVALISAYIRHLRGEGLEDLSTLVDRTRTLTPFVAIGADVNGHSAWWGPRHLPSNATGQLVEDFILSQSLEVVNRWPSQQRSSLSRDRSPGLM